MLQDWFSCFEKNHVSVRIFDEVYIMTSKLKQINGVDLPFGVKVCIYLAARAEYLVQIRVKNDFWA